MHWHTESLQSRARCTIDIIVPTSMLYAKAAYCSIREVSTAASLAYLLRQLTSGQLHYSSAPGLSLKAGFRKPPSSPSTCAIVFVASLAPRPANSEQTIVPHKIGANATGALRHDRGMRRAPLFVLCAAVSDLSYGSAYKMRAKRHSMDAREAITTLFQPPPVRRPSEVAKRSRDNHYSPVSTFVPSGSRTQTTIRSEECMHFLPWLHRPQIARWTSLPHALCRRAQLRRCRDDSLFFDKANRCATVRVQCRANKL